MDCKRCGSPIRHDSKFEECSRCRRTCPTCGGKKDLFSIICTACRHKKAEENAAGGSSTWYLSREEQEKQKARVRSGLCKYGCGRPAIYPANSLVKHRCSESANQCPVMVGKQKDGLQRHWDGLSDSGREQRSRLAGQKIRDYRRGLTGEEKAKQLLKRSQNQTWRKGLSDSRKSLIERGLAVNLNGCGYSKACRELCDALVVHFPQDEVYYDSHGGERIFPGGFRADFLNRTRKFIVEFNGDFWHCNPKTWKAKDYNRAIKMTASDKWGYDEKRRKIFSSCGYKVIVVWESAWLSDASACVQSVLEQIKGV